MNFLLIQAEESGDLDDPALAPRPEQLSHHWIHGNWGPLYAQLVGELVVSHVEYDIDAPQIVEERPAHDIVWARLRAHLGSDHVHVRAHVLFKVQVEEHDVEVDDEVLQLVAPHCHEIRAHLPRACGPLLREPELCGEYQCRTYVEGLPHRHVCVDVEAYVRVQLEVPQINIILQ